MTAPPTTGDPALDDAVTRFALDVLVEAAPRLVGYWLVHDPRPELEADDPRSRSDQVLLHLLRGIDTATIHLVVFGDWRADASASFVLRFLPADLHLAVTMEALVELECWAGLEALAEIFRRLDRGPIHPFRIYNDAGLRGELQLSLFVGDARLQHYFVREYYLLLLCEGWLRLVARCPFHTAWMYELDQLFLHRSMHLAIGDYLAERAVQEGTPRGSTHLYQKLAQDFHTLGRAPQATLSHTFQTTVQEVTHVRRRMTDYLRQQAQVVAT